MLRTFLAAVVLGAGIPSADSINAKSTVQIIGEVELFEPGVASTHNSEVRLTISPDGRTALWFSRNRPGGAGGYDIWMSRRTQNGWQPATPVPFNSTTRDFDPAFSADGHYVYFCSNRAGGTGGDDIYRVEMFPSGFGQPENLGPAVNSTADEFAPMLSPDGRRLLFSSDRDGGKGRHDLYLAVAKGGQFQTSHPLPGILNTAGDEFDATFLSDNSTIIFSRAPNMQKDRIDLYQASARHGRYDLGTVLPLPANHGTKDTYGPMLDWSRPDSITLSSARDGVGSMDLYRIHYRIAQTSH